MRIARRALVGMTLATAAVRSAAAQAPPVRVGVLRYGTVSWEVDVIRHHALDAAAHITVVPVELAGRFQFENCFPVWRQGIDRRRTDN